MPIRKKKVVYLLGAGASQAEATLIDDGVHLLMRDVKDGILEKIIRKKVDRFKLVRNELAAEHVDVEQLITLYESSGNREHKSAARFLKQAFRDEIQDRIEQLDRAFSSSARYFSPRLSSALIDMHGIAGFGEKLMGIMTLNYEDILERAVRALGGCVNYAVEVVNACDASIKIRRRGILVLKMHGSFNWKNEFPISIKDRIKNEDDVLWIPPGVEKHNETYPFNVIWGKARELLNCDVLRIVGCSLSRNDWLLVSLLYSTQKLNRSRREYIIEIIDYPEKADAIAIAYPHLRVRKMTEIKEVIDFVKGSLSHLPSSGSRPEMTERTISDYLASQKNIFDTWLRAKGEDIQNRGISLKTNSSIFSNYMSES